MEQVTHIEECILKFQPFKGLETNPAALHCLQGLVKYEVFNTHDFIINEKLNEPRMFFLLSGNVEINKIDERGTIVAIGKTDATSHPYFGESILFDDYKRSANVVAHSRCECLSLTKENFDFFSEKHPSLVATFYQHLAKLLFERLAKADTDIFIATIAFKKRNDRWRN